MVGNILKVISACGTTLLLDLNKSLSNDQSNCSICHMITNLYKSFMTIRGLPLITYAPRERGGVKSPIHFHCVLHAKRGGGGPNSM